MTVFVKRKGVRLIATFPKGSGPWKLFNMRGRIVAIAPDHPPMIMGEDGMTLEQVNLNKEGGDAA